MLSLAKKVASEGPIIPNVSVDVANFYLVGMLTYIGVEISSGKVVQEVNKCVASVDAIEK